MVLPFDAKPEKLAGNETRRKHLPGELEEGPAVAREDHDVPLESVHLQQHGVGGQGIVSGFR